MDGATLKHSGATRHKRGTNGHPTNVVQSLITPAHALARPPRKTSPHGLRIAAIDIGTNSLHMAIVEVTDSLAFKILSSDKDLTQLGSAALVQHHLTKRAMQHTIEVLERYQRIANSQ